MIEVIIRERDTGELLRRHFGRNEEIKILGHSWSIPPRKPGILARNGKLLDQDKKRDRSCRGVWQSQFRPRPSSHRGLERKESKERKEREKNRFSIRGILVMILSITMTITQLKLP